MATELVRAEVSEFSQLAETAPKVAETLQTVDKLTAQLPPLMVKARSTEVTFPDREGYQAVGAVLTEVRALKKQGEAHLSPFEVLVSRVATFLRTARQKHVNQCTEIEGVILPKMKAWEKAELAETQKEQKQMEKQAAKTGQPAPTVQHNIPSTAGYRRSTLYRVEVTDANTLIHAYFKAAQSAKTREQAVYLRQFITIDEQKLAKVFREDVKDPKQFMKQTPGIKAWVE